MSPPAKVARGPADWWLWYPRVGRRGSRCRGSRFGHDQAGRTMTQQLSADRFDAALFDLDGVITDTAAVHARA
jgi:hypothetical protein